ncbi:EamA family transporter [Bradyrhizobium sp. CCBAU 53340]|uniref:EamA family transporter n=2 Tax=Bradyrhizobium TaxID=374 RepID=UPI0035305446
MVLVAYGGLKFAPAAHGASLFTALIPLLVAILAAIVLGETFTVSRQIGLASIVAGALLIVGGAGATIGSRQNIGHARSSERRCCGPAIPSRCGKRD